MRRVGIASFLLAAVFVTTAAAGELITPSVSVLRLRTRADVSGVAPRLMDVLNFAEADPRLTSEVAEKPLFAQATKGMPSSISHEDVAARLTALGVNPARVLVSGARACELVSKTPAAAIAAAAPAFIAPRTPPSAVKGASLRAFAENDPPPVNPMAPSRGTAAGVDATKPDPTLAAAVQSYVAGEIRGLGGTVELAFERAGQEFIALTSPPWEFTVRSGGGDKLGLREFTIIIRRDGKLKRTVQLAARVRLVKNVLVARRPLNVGAFVARDDLGLETRMFEAAAEVGTDQIDALIGRQVERFVPVGELVRPHDTKPVELVKRSRPVTVLSGNDAVRTQVSGAALDSGAYGDTVRVRLGESSRERREVRAVVTGLGTVKLVQEQL